MSLIQLSRDGSTEVRVLALRVLDLPRGVCHRRTERFHKDCLCICWLYYTHLAMRRTHYARTLLSSSHSIHRQSPPVQRWANAQINPLLGISRNPRPVLGYALWHSGGWSHPFPIKSEFSFQAVQIKIKSVNTIVQLFRSAIVFFRHLT